MDSDTRPFLEVAQSVSQQRWIERADRRQLGQAQSMVEQRGIDPLLARVMAGRGVVVEQAEDFLNPTLRHLMPDPSTVTDMDRAASVLADAVEGGTPVAIFGDYDVDGATASAVLAQYLRHCGLSVEVYIPDRIFEGYGPNPAAIRELVDRGARLLVTVDCGSTSLETLALAKSLGTAVLVLDHHQVGDHLPEVDALVNPNRQDDLSGLGYLCAAGVVFLSVVALNRELRRRGFFSSRRQAPDLMAWLDLVALGTVCDVVPLTGLNRAFVTRGIEVMQKQTNVGLAELAKVARLDGPVAPFHLGFVLGPRINAGGRIGDAALGARLLMSSDQLEAEGIAAQLDMLNGERQALEREMLEQAINEAEAEIGTGEGPAVLVTESDTWHAGIVGLLASRLKDRFNRPAFAITFDDRDIGTGSGRSINGADLGAAVRAAVEEGILVKGGGHGMAAGITIERRQLGTFRAFLDERLGATVARERDQRVLKIDGALSARGASVEFFDRLQQAGPYGAGHSQPVFAFPHHTVRYADIVGADHVRFTLSARDGAEVKGISFRSSDTPLGQLLLSSRGSVLHLAGTLSADFYRGTRRVQLRLLDAAKVPDRV